MYRYPNHRIKHRVIELLNVPNYETQNYIKLSFSKSHLKVETKKITERVT